MQITLPAVLAAALTRRAAFANANPEVLARRAIVKYLDLADRFGGQDVDRLIGVLLALGDDDERA